VQSTYTVEECDNYRQLTRNHDDTCQLYPWPTSVDKAYKYDSISDQSLTAPQHTATCHRRIASSTFSMHYSETWCHSSNQREALHTTMDGTRRRR